MTRTTKRSARRAGFTLVEMLVVVIIVGILLSLVAAAALKLIGTQQQFNTQTELTRLEGDLVRAYRATADKARKEPIPNQGSPMGNVYYNYVLPTLANNDRNLARVIWTKLRSKQTFPNNFAEAWNPSPMPGLSYYQTKLTALRIHAASFPPTISPYAPKPWESSVCLLWALQRGESGSALKESDIGTGSLKDFGLIPTSAKDPSSGQTPNGALGLPTGSVKGLVDNWGTPLAFCRWPVYSLQLNPAPTKNPPPPPAAPGVYYPQNGDNNDPDDPSGLLESTTWQATGGFTLFQQLCHPLVPHTAGTEAQTYRIFPLIVSAGPDRRLGLDKEPVTAAGVGPAYYAIGTQPAQYYFGVQTGLQSSPQVAPGSLSLDNIYPTLATPK